MNGDEPLLKADEVARMLGIARSTVFDWARKGELPSVVLRRGNFRAVRRWRPADVRKLIEEGAVG